MAVLYVKLTFEGDSNGLTLPEFVEKLEDHFLDAAPVEGSYVAAVQIHDGSASFDTSPKPPRPGGML